MDETPKPITSVEQFTAAMLEAAHIRTDERWVVARIRPGEQPVWLAGFSAYQPLWASKANGAAIHNRDDAELARLQCTDLPNPDDVLYAVCHLKAGNDAERDQL